MFFGRNVRSVYLLVSTKFMGYLGAGEFFGGSRLTRILLLGALDFVGDVIRFQMLLISRPSFGLSGDFESRLIQTKFHARQFSRETKIEAFCYLFNHFPQLLDS